MYYYDAEKKFPLVGEGRGMNDRQRWIVSLSVLSLCLCSATLLFVAYHNHLFGLGIDCPKKSMYFRADSPNIDKVLWDYAAYWSNKAKNEKSFTIFLDTIHPEHDPDMLMNGLTETFQPLSLRPCPVPCRKRKIAKQSYRQSRRNRARGPTFVDNGLPFGGLPLGPLFEVELGSEFKFRDDVMNEANENMMEIMEKMANESFDQLITIYLSTLTPTIEMKLSRNGSKVRESQSTVIQTAMDGYRNASNPLFLILGNHSEAAGIDGDDVLKQAYVPDSVALAILSVSNETIFNYGLWPAFGALLAKSNVTSFAMDKQLLDAARNASLNWTTSVTY